MLRFSAAGKRDLSHLLRGHENVSHLFDPMMMVSATRTIKQSRNPETLHEERPFFPHTFQAPKGSVLCQQECSIGISFEYGEGDSLEQPVKL